MSGSDADRNDDHPSESPHESDVTSAAHANWLAELRATAKTSRRTLAEVVDDTPEPIDEVIEPERSELPDPASPASPASMSAASVPSTDAMIADDDHHDGDADRNDDDDDDVTIGGADALAEIRAAVQAARDDAPLAEDPAASAEPTSTVDEPPRPAPRVEAPPTVPASGLAPPTPDVALSNTPNRPVQRDANAPAAPRWESPARLSTAMSPDAPRLNLTSPQTSRADWRIVAGAVVVALAIGFFVARALTGGGGSPEVDPDDSVVPQDRDTEQVDE